jgi:hypothetical protein
MAICPRLTAPTTRALVMLALAALGASSTFAGDEAPLRGAGPPVPIPEASLDLAESDIARVGVDGKDIHLKLMAPAREKLRAVTAANVGGKITLTLDGEVLLKTWVAGEVDSGNVVLQDVKEPLRKRLETSAHRLAPGGSVTQ